MIGKGDLIRGGLYNFRHQQERLIFLGFFDSWCRFALVETPGVVWCEVSVSDLHLMEVTTNPVTVSNVGYPA